MNRTRGILALLTGTAAAALLVAATPAQAEDEDPGYSYTHPTTTNQACHVYSNYPKDGVGDYGWDVGGGAELDVRFTFGGYALVKDPARSGTDNPLHYGFVNQGCLVDPHAYNGDYSQALGDQQGTGGGGVVEYVDMAPNPGSEADLVHVTSPGTLRSDPGSFPIGNVRLGDAFYITTATCGHHGQTGWIFGRDTNSGRWGYVESQHFTACT